MAIFIRCVIMLDNVIRNMHEVNIYSIIFRLTLAFLCGGLIGFNRERKRRPAGFRTHILVCIGSALVMITNQYTIDILGYSSDPNRLGAQVISGIGFLGAGTILVTGKQQVKGLTTAAGLWASACMGLAIGIGFYEGALICCVYIFGSMTLLHRLDKYVQSKTRLEDIFVEVNSDKAISSIIKLIQGNNIEISNIEILKTRNKETVGLNITLKYRDKNNRDGILALVGGVDEVIIVKKI